MELVPLACEDEQTSCVSLKLLRPKLGEDTITTNVTDRQTDYGPTLVRAKLPFFAKEKSGFKN